MKLSTKLLNTPEIERPTSHRTANSQASIALQNRQLWEALQNLRDGCMKPKEFKEFSIQMINVTWRVMKGLTAFCNFDASMQHRTRASSAGAEPNWTTCMRCRRSMQSRCYPHLDSCELVLAPVCPVLQSLWCHLLAPLMGDLNFGRWNHITKVTKPNVTRSHQLAVLLDTPLTMGSVRILGLRLAAVVFSSVDIW